MRLPERLLATLLIALLLAACGSGAGNARATRVRWEGQMQDYAVRDDRGARTRMRHQEVLRLAGDRYARGDLEAARGYARSAQKLAPDDPAAYTLQAAIEGRLGDQARAQALYRKATELAPRQGEILNNYGAWLCANGYPAEALVWFDRALEDAAYAARAEALANAGGCALDAGQNERAGQDLRQALALTPTNAFALESMARHAFLSGRNLEARAFYQRRLAAAQATASVLQLAIQIEERLGDTRAASRYQQRLREEFPAGATPNSQG
ncbi:type IV pilus biogenesis/stability protein PilW [Stenotrophomonas mori]|uniref:Type IV pilus biogenesis/stability protein PilW n=1 Tax=Stenotrophomonas mori TaxID=2871096 RepID=A0ABT0SFI2_9GAMM|nr:type IV pilus biogenesis/stability protein PilW [Stenotrophomonas mori]MCL7714022.1 type IV pilus biogenesis/stability protein PilW [Stenotrophomonas mori]